MTPAKTAEIQASFARQTLMQTLGASLGDMRAGMVEIIAPILPTARQQHGFAHAGLTFALGDSAAGYTALSLLPEGTEVLTAEIKINLLAPGKGDRLIARGRVIKPGKRLVVVASDVFAETTGQETLIATLMGTMVPVTP
jgi:uncharacterized protein (TIGR00369 family)